MGAFQRWLDKQPDSSACPDPEDFDCDDLPRQDDDAITAHGYDSRATPIDTLMNGPMSMGLQHAHDMEYGDYA